MFEGILTIIPWVREWIEDLVEFAGEVGETRDVKAELEGLD